jgi:NAD(P)H-dependent FMN reductase
MITIIAGTNREDSMTLKMANVYHDLLSTMTDEPVLLLSLQNQQVWERGNTMTELEKHYLIPAQKFVFIMPEYNASFPGILKLMMDNSDIKKCWWLKKAILVGISDGRAGNLRGIEHMTAILHYMKVNVHYNKLIISRINEEINKKGEIIKPETEATIRQHIEDLLQF